MKAKDAQKNADPQLPSWAAILEQQTARHETAAADRKDLLPSLRAEQRTHVPCSTCHGRGYVESEARLRRLCPGCAGRGFVVTSLGLAVLDLLARVADDRPLVSEAELDAHNERQLQRQQEEDERRAAEWLEEETRQVMVAAAERGEEMTREAAKARVMEQRAKRQAQLAASLAEFRRPPSAGTTKGSTRGGTTIGRWLSTITGSGDGEQR